ncbi:aspartate/tyrosine/aromatic aminotransferase [Rhodobacteraceae bacterium KMM 6894]|nr:aspartate/tyrosine/aromatic aminotransferase [Rhodobacteraceae bacterium KMM 6894]
MLSALKPQSPDKILQLMQTFRADPRDDKIDLGVGVYKDTQGNTPIMRAVKQAEKNWWQDETTKSYVALAGDPAFTNAMIDLILADALPRDCVAAAATPGGTGALRQAFELIKLASPDARVFVSTPTWPNHLSILDHLGIETVPYRYFDATTGAVDTNGMLDGLKALRPGDVALLHGCCHNPTGANLTLPEWQAVADLLNAKGAIPMIDIAYQGFGDGLTEDAAPTRLIAKSCPETIIAASCSKNFGIYRERTGILMATSQDSTLTPVTQGTLAHLNRQNFSFPPDHGARLVSLILTDSALRTDWQSELEDMRTTMLANREHLATELRRASNSDRFDFIAHHRGMFSRLGITSEKVEQLRNDHAIYMVGDSRINIAGLTPRTIPILAKAMIDVGA